MTTASDISKVLETLHQVSAIEPFQQILKQIQAGSQDGIVVPNYKLWIDALLNSNLSIVAKRSLLEHFISELKRFPCDSQKAIGLYAVDRLHTAVASYEEQDTALRELLADAFTSEEEYAQAAKVLQGIQLESSQRKVSDSERFDIWIRICRLYLEEDDTTTAETYLNRAKNLLYQVNDQESQLKFKLSQARISDSQRRFLEAAAVYHDISTVTLLASEERDLTLARAIICAILAPAGSLRSALLRRLYRDERAYSLTEYEMLENMYLGRLVPPDQVKAFAQKLDPHQVAQTSTGETVLAKAVTEHNLLGISKVYESIGLADLGMLLGLGPVKTQKHASAMIEQQRLQARIDHVDGFVVFTGQNVPGKDRKFDGRIRSLLEEVERVATLLSD